jgi:hypothetical protein
MAIVTVTPKQWAGIFAPKIQAHRPRTHSRRVAYTFHKTGGAFQHYHGPGRKTKRIKNAGVTHLHSNRL